MAGRQGREGLIKKGLLEMMEQGEWEGRPGGWGAGPGNTELGLSRGPRGLVGTEWKSGVWCPREAGPRGGPPRLGASPSPDLWARPRHPPAPQSPVVSERPPPTWGAELSRHFPGECLIASC